MRHLVRGLPAMPLKYRLRHRRLMRGRRLPDSLRCRHKLPGGRPLLPICQAGRVRQQRRMRGLRLMRARRAMLSRRRGRRSLRDPLFVRRALRERPKVHGGEPKILRRHHTPLPNPDAGSRGTCYQNYICESAVLDPCVGMVCPSGQACEGAGECVDRPESDAGYPEDTVGPDAVDAPPDIAQTESDTLENPVDIAQPDGRDEKPLDPAATDEPQHIYLRSEGCACSSSPVQDEAPASLMLLGAFGLGILWRRRR